MNRKWLVIALIVILGCVFYFYYAENVTKNNYSILKIEHNASHSPRYYIEGLTYDSVSDKVITFEYEVTENIEQGTIPKWFRPLAVISFDENCKMIILEEGRDDIVVDDPNNMDFSGIDFSSLPEVFPGLTVSYDGMGFPNKYYVDEQLNDIIDDKDVEGSWEFDYGSDYPRTGDAFDLENYYISLSMSDNVDDVVSDFMGVYHIGSSEYSEIYRLVAQAQTSKAYIDIENNTAYYLDRVLTKHKWCDQIFAYNYLTEKVTQLTTGLEAVNYLWKVDSRLYFVGSRFGNFNLEFGYVDLNEGSIWFSPDFDHKDVTVSSLYYNYNDNTFYFTYYLDSEDSERLRAFYKAQSDKIEGNYYARPPSYLCKADLDGNIIESVQLADEKGVRDFTLAADNQSALLTCINSNPEQMQVIWFKDIANLNDYEVIDVLSTNGKYRASKAFISPDGKGAFVTVVIDSEQTEGKDTTYSLAYYDFAQEELTIILTLPGTYISDIKLILKAK